LGKEFFKHQWLASNLKHRQKSTKGFGLIMVLNKSIRVASMWLFAGLIASLLSACTPEINHRGYIAKAGAFSQLSEGMPKAEVEGILGSPSTTASINFQGDSFYYITSITEGRSFLKPIETNREIIAVRFDKQDRVAGLAQYGLQDGRIINLQTRKTPVVGSEFSLLQELFKGISAGAGGGDILKRKL
jgi:outer membrane protein assembly factor BamE (lipoprotein component of BamABCDE complex)